MPDNINTNDVKVDTGEKNLKGSSTKTTKKKHENTIATSKKESTQVYDDTAKMLGMIEDAVNDVANNDISKIKRTRINAVNTDVNKQVLCTSIVFGTLVYQSSKTGAMFKWPEFGSTEWMPFYELQTMNNDNRTYLNKPNIIINDADIISYFNLNDVYKRVAKTYDLETAIKHLNLESLREIMSEATKYGLRDIMIAKLRKMRGDKELSNVDVIRILSEEFDIDLEI